MIRYLKILSIAAMLLFLAPHAKAYDVIYDSGPSTGTFTGAATGQGMYLSSDYSGLIPSNFTVYSVVVQGVNGNGTSHSGFYITIQDAWVGTFCTSDNTVTIGPGTADYQFYFSSGCSFSTVSPGSYVNGLTTVLRGFTGSIDVDRITVAHPITSDPGLVGQWYGASYPGADTSTRITSVTPYAGQQVATSTSFGFAATGFVNPNDFISGNTFVHIRAQDRNQSVAFVSVSQVADTTGFVTKDFYFPVTTSGAFSFSTTTNMTGQIGVYYMDTTVDVPGWNVFGFNFGTQSIAATSTAFILSTTTLADRISLQIGSDINELLNASSTGQLDCSITKISQCLYMLVVPSKEDFNADFNALRDNVLTHRPWGYVTRFVTVITASTSAALPTFTANLRIGPPSNLATTSLTFDPGDMLVGGAALLTNLRDLEHGQNLRDITEPMLWLFIGITILIIIVHDIMAMGHHRKPPPTTLH